MNGGLRKQLKKQGGVSLIELVVSIVIISISLTGVMMVITQAGRTSADPMIRSQATAIARAYMEEILGQPLNDPDGGETGASESGETRATFDDVSDYHGLSDSGAVDQQGNAIPGLGSYNVQVGVFAETLSGAPAKRIRIDVTFAGDAEFQLPLVAYRMR